MGWRNGVSLLLVASLLFTGCAGKDVAPEYGSDPYRVRSTSEHREEGWIFGPVMPYPMGSATWEDDPAVVVLGWTGMALGVAVVAATFFVMEDTFGGQADTGAFVAVAALALPIIVVGGLVLTLPYYGLRALWQSIFGSPEEPVPSP